MDELLRRAEKAGFEYFTILDIKTIQLLPEIRRMCQANICGMYGKNWSCPPGCGSLEECRARIAKYNIGFIVQTVDELENSFDVDGMMEIQDKHQRRSLNLRYSLSNKYKDILYLGVGACTICEKCIYPNKACLFQDKMISSLESYGILVSQLCKDNGLNYYYGPGSISYTSCFLLLADSQVNEKKA
ncbi:DUF2284 domain-containing protein [Schnuerera sp. xch1]|uniref:DUF2284 domain-containing protein n=1 Tax=Schnuerera sp. xch1 TaxID=2874283 RepID=UPI001CBC79E1|nr:DUF2284 domain-containing protein [Schnuerera sp. xch1]MBZ2174797.1 DUF2284 domain-containing protein [Schnuerera sp. xch1]